MAIYHLSAQIISRKSGRSSTAAAAYRAGERIVDERTGEIHDYARKAGVSHTEIVMPSGSEWAPTRSELWNEVEAKNKRADSQVAREFLVALPDELDEAQRRELAVGFARELADKYQIAVDVAIHAPGREGDQRNHHAHILTSTNKVQGHGFGNKVRELDFVAHTMAGKGGQVNEIDLVRQRWEHHANQALEKAGQEARIDHRSLEAQGIYDRAPTAHLGPDATAIKRRGGVSTVEERAKEQASEFLADMQAQVALQRAAERDVAELEDQLAAAKWEALPVSERLATVRETQTRMLQELQDLRDRKRFADTAAKVAMPQAEVQKGIDALPAVRKAAGQAKARLEQVEAREAGLGWWQWIERRRVKSEKAKAQADATARAERLIEVRQLAQRPVREKVEAEQQAVASGLAKHEAEYMPLTYELVDLEAQQKALQAQQAAIEAQRQAKALAEANRATSERIKAQVAQRQAERAAPKVKVKERDSGPSLG